MVTLFSGKLKDKEKTLVPGHTGLSGKAVLRTSRATSHGLTLLRSEQHKGHMRWNGSGFYLASLKSLVCAMGPGLPLGTVVWEAGGLTSTPSLAPDPLDVTVPVLCVKQRS